MQPVAHTLLDYSNIVLLMIGTRVVVMSVGVAVLLRHSAEVGSWAAAAVVVRSFAAPAAAAVVAAHRGLLLLTIRLR